MSLGRNDAQSAPLLRSASMVSSYTDSNDQGNLEDAKPATPPQSTPLTKEEIHSTNFYKTLYKVNLILAVSALLGEVTFGIYSRTYAAKGSVTMAQAMGFNIDDLPTNYGDIATPDGFKPNAPALIEAIGWSAAWAEIVNGAFQFDVKSTAKESAADVVAWAYKLKADGVCASFTKSLCDTFSSGSKFLRSSYNMTSLLLFSVATVASAYADVEQTKEPLEDWFGHIGGDIVIAWQGLGAVYYCIQTFLPKTQAGMEFIWDGPNFGARIKNHGNPLIELQYLLEFLQTILIRAGSLSFLFGRLAEQWELDPTFFYVLGALGGLAQGMQVFAPGTHKKYHGLVDGVVTNAAGERKPVDPITQSERDQAHKRLYANMPALERARTEFLRIFVIGVAQMGLGFYGLSKATHTYISEWLVSEGSSKEEADAMAYTAAAVASTLLYLPAYKASRYAELNVSANKHREKQLKAAARNQAVSSTPSDSNVIANSTLNEIRVETSPQKSGAGPTSEDLDRILEDALLEFDTSHPSQGKSSATPPPSETKENARALTPVVADRPAVVQPVEEKIEPNLFAKVVGIGASIISQATRIPTFVASLANNQLIGGAISKQDLSVVGAAIGATVGDNRFRVMTDGCVETIAKLGCNTRCTRRVMESLQRLRGSSKPKAADLSAELTPTPVRRARGNNYSALAANSAIGNRTQVTTIPTPTAPEQPSSSSTRKNSK
jgi:hypothetical protein